MWKKIKKCLSTLSASLQNDPDSIHLEVEKNSFQKILFKYRDILFQIFKKYTIKEINSKYKSNWDFGCLHYLFNEVVYLFQFYNKKFYLISNLILTKRRLKVEKAKPF